MDSFDAPFDQSTLRTALGAFLTGVTVITTRDAAGVAHGLTANSFNTVSLDPPLILWSQSRRAGSYPVFQAAREFAISILAEDQIDVSMQFAKAQENKFAAAAVDSGFCGLPVIHGSSAWLYCKTVSQVDGGDHTIYIGQVLRIARSNRRALAFGGGQYMLTQPHHAAFPGDSSVPTGARQRHALRICVPHMQRIAVEDDITVCAGVWGNCGPTIVGWEAGRSCALPSFPLGLVLPVTSSATGKAFAAFLPEAVSRPLVDAELAGWSARRSEWPDIVRSVQLERSARQEPTRFWNEDVLIEAVSVPVCGSDGNALVTMTAVVGSGMPIEVLAAASEKLRAASNQIERQLKSPPKTQRGTV